MRHRAAVVITLATLIAPGTSNGQVVDAADTLSTETVTMQHDSSQACSFGMLLLRMNSRRHPATSLSFYSRPDINMHIMYGYEFYKASTYECVLRGAGAGMSMGMAAGAFGMMTGAWDERRAWYIAGAAAAAGAIFGKVKSDDPGWSIRVRLDPDR